MKKFILVSLLAVSFCRAADEDVSWNQAVETKYPDVDYNALLMWEEDIDLSSSNVTAIPKGLGFSSATSLNLSGNKISQIPERLSLPLLENLDLSNNQLIEITPEQIEQFPKLRLLNVSGNQGIDQKQVRALQERFPNLTIEAQNLGCPSIKKAKQ